VTYTCAPPALLTALMHNEALLAQTDISSLLELRDELPRNPLGKILKRDLREELRRAHDLPGRWTAVQVKELARCPIYPQPGAQRRVSPPGSAGREAARPAWGCGRRSRSA
jgi:hypothetical protein